MTTRRRVLAWATLVVSLLVLASCSQIRYYSQAVRGGLEILNKRQGIEKLLARETLDPETRRKFELILEARAFASSELGLPDNRSYTSYVDLGRDTVTWNVFAAPELSVEPHTWCFLIVGCTTYRGYFSQRAAQRYAARLEKKGFDVAVRGSSAYSTLGWFADPVLSNFLALDDAALVGLLFHELAHQVLYVPGDTTFNESFATTVELYGARRFLEAQIADPAAAEQMLEHFESTRRAERALVERFEQAREQLEHVYRTSSTPEEALTAKAELLETLRNEFQTDPRFASYRAWGEVPLNNAYLASVSAYHALEPGFSRLLEDVGGDLQAFYLKAEELAKLDWEARRERLQP